MKKILTTICLAVLLSSVLLSGGMTVARADTPQAEYEHDTDLPIPLIGTWRRIGDESRIYVFREGGTGLTGRPGTRTPITWDMVDGELHRRAAPRRSYSLDGDILTVEFRPRMGGPYMYTYVFYSESTDLYEVDNGIFRLVMWPTVGLVGLYIIWRIWKRIKSRQLSN